MNPKPETTKPNDCVAQGHEITRMFGEAKKGRVEADCVCWTCTKDRDWIEVWVFEKIVEESL